MSKEFEKTWQTYTAAWKTASPHERQQLLEAALEPLCKYADPQISVEGFAALSDCIAGFQQQFPGAHFVTTQFWSHGRTCLARWEMRGASGVVLGEGASYGEFSAAGKLATATAFFDVPAA